MNNINITLTRVLASVIDWGICASLVMIVIALLGKDPEQVLHSALISNMFVLGLMVIIEVFLISNWDKTPGMALMGLTVRNADGSKLSFGKALVRGLLVFVEGSALGLPFYWFVLIAWGINLVKLLITGTAFWDDQLRTVVDGKKSAPQALS